MKLDGRIEIAAPASEVWQLINDPVGLAACVPGVKDLARIDERTFRGSISAAVGPMEGHFEFTSTITASTFPADLQVETVGTDSVTRSQLVASVAASLESPDPARTLLVYRATVNVKGRLAILGEMMLRATAGAMIGEVVRCLRTRLEQDPVAAGPDADPGGGR